MRHLTSADKEMYLYNNVSSYETINTKKFIKDLESKGTSQNYGLSKIFKYSALRSKVSAIKFYFYKKSFLSLSKDYYPYDSIYYEKLPQREKYMYIKYPSLRKSSSIVFWPDSN